MAWDPCMNEMFPQTVQLTPPGAMNAYGRQARGTAVDVAALVEVHERMARSVKGEQIASTTSVYVTGANGVLGVTPDWTATVDGQERHIVSVDVYHDFDGPLYEILRLQ